MVEVEVTTDGRYFCIHCSRMFGPYRWGAGAGADNPCPSLTNGDRHELVARRHLAFTLRRCCTDG